MQERYIELDKYKSYTGLKKKDSHYLSKPGARKKEVVLEYAEGLKCHLPPVPAKKNILFSTLPKSKQKWMLIRPPIEWEDWVAEENEYNGHRGPYEEKWYHPKAEQYRLIERDRRTNGLWFMNNGEPTYITGKHYFHLNEFHLKHQNGYPNYKDELREFYYFKELVWENPKCYGYVFGGGRGTSKTACVASDCIEEMTRPIVGTGAAIQSKSEEDARKSVFDTYIVHGWNKLDKDKWKLNDYFQTDQPRNTLDISKPRIRGKRAKEIDYEKAENLNNFISVASSTEKALDGQTLRYIIQDEIGKTLPEENKMVDKRLQVNIKCVDRDGRKQGHICCTTTVEEMDKGGAIFEKIWLESDQNNIHPDIGTTQTGLFRYFMPIQISDSEFRDEYGVVDIERALAKQFAIHERLQLDEDQLMAHKRKHPTCVDDMFLYKAGSSGFNIKQLQERVNEIKAIGNITRRGRLEWTSGEFSSVEFIDDPLGGFQVSEMPPANKLNKVKQRGSYLVGSTLVRSFVPEADELYSIGVDPVDQGGDKIKGYSKPVALGKHRFSIDVKKYHITSEKMQEMVLNGEKNHNAYFIMYDLREKDPIKYYESMLKMIWWLGCPIMIERNRGNSLINYLMQKGMREFILMSNDKPGFMMDNRTKISNLQLLKEYNSYFYKKWPFIEVLKDMIEYRPERQTKHDYVVAAGACELADQRENRYLLMKGSKRAKDFKNLLSYFKN